MKNKITQDQMNNFKNAINKVQLNENMNFMGMGQQQMPSRPPMGQPQQRRRMPMGGFGGGQPPMMGQGQGQGQQPPMMGGFGGGQPPMMGQGQQPPMMGGFGGGQPPMMGQGQQPPKPLGQQQDAMKMPGMGGPSSQTVSAQDQFGALEEPEPSMFGGQPPMGGMGQGQQPPMMGGFGGGQPPMGGMGQGQRGMGQPPMMGQGQRGMGQPPMMGQGQPQMPMNRRRRPQGGFGDMSMYGESFNQNKKKI